MQANLNSIAIIALGMANFYLYNSILGIKKDILFKETDRLYQFGLMMGKWREIENEARQHNEQVKSVEKKVDKYLDMENPFNITVAGDEV